MVACERVLVKPPQEHKHPNSTDLVYGQELEEGDLILAGDMVEGDREWFKTNDAGTVHYSRARTRVRPLGRHETPNVNKDKVYKLMITMLLAELVHVAADKVPPILARFGFAKGDVSFRVTNKGRFWTEVKRWPWEPNKEDK